MKSTFAAVFCVAAAAAVSTATASAPHARACAGRDLSAHVAMQGATGKLLGGVTVTNRSGRACSVSGRANVDFLQGTTPLRVFVLPGASTTGSRQTSTIRLAPRARAFVLLQWTNWCGPSYMHVGVRLWLLSLKPRLAVGGSVSTPPCTNRGGRSTVQVGPWEAR